MMILHNSDNDDSGLHSIGDDYDAAWVNGSILIFCGSFECRGWLHLGITMFVLGLEIMWTVTGNLLVVIAILYEKHLRVPANYLIFNLACADLLVGSLVMPISAVREISVHWILGKIICEIHCHLDVLCCTSSILTLLAIAWDRSLAVRNINYIQQRTPKRMLAMIGIVWFVAFCITIPQAITKYLLEQRDESDDARHNETSQLESCNVPQDWYYQLYATSCSFYIPLVLIVFLYIRIYQTARSTIRKDKFRGARISNASSITMTIGAENSLLIPNSPSVTIIDCRNSREHHIGTDRDHHDSLSVKDSRDYKDNHLEMESNYVKNDPVSTNDFAQEMDSSRVSSDGANETQPPVRPSLRFNDEPKTNGKRSSDVSALKRPTKAQQRQTRVEQKREKKAARVLLIVTGTFIACWAPFFLAALVMAFCADACYFEYQPLLLSIVLWLGYTCSACNPIIYTVFSPDFRHAFQKILHLQRRV